MKKFTAFFLGTSLSLGLVACGPTTNSSNLSNSLSNSSTTRQVLRVGLECGYAPFNWTDATDNATNYPIHGSIGYCDGYDVTVAQYVANELGYDLEIKKIDWEGLIISLDANQIDVIIAGMSPTAERALVINFTEEYYNSDQVVVVRKNEAYATADAITDFSGATLVAQLGTLQDRLIQETSGIVHGTAYNSYPEAFTALLNNNEIDGVVAEYPVAQAAVANNDQLTIVRFAEGNGFVVSAEDVVVSMGLRKSDTVLLEDLNTVLAGISKETRDQWMLDAIARQPE